ncbi:TIGR03086 family protein [Actinomadura sp. KC216]|uniref:TIGR03086 family metal-binding protein n=1 Tax=Actinomadura sp. KC216 TaxID=2530370 RepID=UPI0010500663|nr:TIGR03086 family metal-binding protein [Actinomadura sp. KC216]TDB73891.1 TIGR03086 family protein [Actinomadura sp. KC216]
MSEFEERYRQRADAAGAAEIAGRYRRRADAFGAKVAAVRDDQWGNPSPCEKWTARDVVQHIVDMHEVMLRPLGRGLSPAPGVAEDPGAAFRAARADVEAVLADPALSARECDTPSGRLTALQHIDQVVSQDLPLHGWDLARATGQDDTIDPADVEAALSGVTAIPAETMRKLRTPGAFGPGVEVFGPEVEVGPDASAQDRLLGFIGRDPRWRP